MKIAESRVSMESSRDYRETESISLEKEILWKGILGDRMEAASSARAVFRSTLVRIRVESLSLSQVFGTPEQDTESRAVQLALVGAILDALFARLARDSTVPPTGVPLGEPQTLSAPAPVDTGLSYIVRRTVRVSRHESETTAFASSGSVRTEEGKAIDFSVELRMDREIFTEELAASVVSGRLIDPLVVNFGQDLPGLSEVTFSFDLNVDGTLEEIPCLVHGTGFLALDRDGDGRVTDGGELFGAVSDNGFAELAAFDEDQNSWIDENDAVFDRLRLWTPDPETGGTMNSLGDSGVGAVFLGSSETRFDMTDEAGNLEARVQRTGIFLGEDGGAGTVQDLKFVV
jgi:hypothetical protein